MPAAISLGAIKPEDAIAAFQARGLLRPSFRWQEVWQAEHARAFAVAGVMRLDILRTIRDEVDGAVRNGETFDAFRRRLRTQLIARGWWGNIEITDPKTGELRRTRFNDARLSLIFDVNMRQSHAAGRWARAMRSRMPYLVYRTMRDERVRASHKPWDNVVLPKAHPWWETHYPPNGWRCRCIAFPVDDAGLQKLQSTGARVITEAPPTQWVEFENKSTGQIERVPRGVDPGFAYNPGQVHVQRAGEQLARSLNDVRSTAALQGEQHRLASAVVARSRSERAFADFLREPPDADISMPVAAMPGLRGEPGIASVAARELRRQASTPDYPRVLPTEAKGWAMAQAVVDRGARLQLAGDRVLWWWVRGEGTSKRVHVLELQRDSLVWWVQQLAVLSREEALAAYPSLVGLA